MSSRLVRHASGRARWTGLVIASGLCTLGFAAPAAAATTATAVAASDAHTCALTNGGVVQCWGSNASGQLGDGSTVNRSTPVVVSGLGSGVTAIATGADHSCAVTGTGGVKCWGSNQYGQLGDGTTTNRLSAVAVSGLSSGVTGISTGVWSTCARTSGGAVKCWGNNDVGELGDGATTNRSTPVDVSGLGNGVAAVSVGTRQACALTNGGAVKCWGGNSDGELGDGTTTNRLAPVDVALPGGVVAVSAGHLATCALTSGGAAMCWGNNNTGQLGDGSQTTRATPVDVDGMGSGATTITSGEGHSCALMSGGSVRCWGANFSGQLADLNTARLSTVPTGVIFRPPPAADQHGNRLFFSTPCNPSTARLDIPIYSYFTPGPRIQTVFLPPFFLNAVGWVDYEGFPVAVLPPFAATQQSGGFGFGAVWPVPSPRTTPPGRYTIHVLLQGNGPAFDSPQLSTVFTTLAETTTIAPGVSADCSPVVAAARASSLARRIRAARRGLAASLERAVGPRAGYPKARLCGRTVCVRRRAGGAWKPIAGSRTTGLETNG